ncbi:hypothetical protein VEE43_40010 [Escherichia coli]|nr:hypothetical protein JSMCR1_4328 [Escherichia coli]BEB41413.1 hypothetical protein VEE43_40010 [Escherichia coli]
MLLAYNLIRREATKAAEKHKKVASPGNILKRLENLRGVA